MIWKTYFFELRSYDQCKFKTKNTERRYYLGQNVKKITRNNFHVRILYSPVHELNWWLQISWKLNIIMQTEPIDIVFSLFELK